jgi:hypothetical protein
MSDQFTPEEVRAIRKIIGSKPKKRTTHVIQVLDESHSMTTGKDITLSSYNEMQHAAKNSVKGEDVITFTLVKFNEHVSIPTIRVSAEYVTPLSDMNYVPNGCTALFDAIGIAIETARNFPTDEDTAYLLQIFTDGYDNSSSKYNADKLKPLIEELQSTGKWTVTVAGPQGNIDLFTRFLGIAKGNVTGFNPDSVSSRLYNGTMMATATSNYFAARSAGQSNVMDSYSSIAKTTADPSDVTGIGQDQSTWSFTNNNLQTGAAQAWPFPGNSPQVTVAQANPAAWPFPTGNKDNRHSGDPC